jgi:hypothetical protein
MHPSLDDNICIPSLLRKAVQSIVRGAGAEGDGRRCVDLLNSEVQLVGYSVSASDHEASLCPPFITMSHLRQHLC